MRRAIAIALALATTAGARADERGSAAVVVDASAQKASRFAEELSAIESAAGGHRPALRVMGGGCDATHATDSIDEARRLKPHGPRPLATALEEAANDLEHAPAPRTVVVVTEGGDECDRDVCIAAEALRHSGAVDAVRVVYFGRGRSRALACLGAVARARTRGELENAVARALHDAFSPAELTVTSAGPDAQVEVYPAGDDVPLARGDSGTTFALAAGKYDLHASMVDGSDAGLREGWSRGVVVAAASHGAQQVPLDRGPAKVLVRVRLNGNPAPAGTRVFLHPPGDRVTEVETGFPDEPFFAPPGRYDVRATVPGNALGELEVWRSDVELVSGETTTVQLDARQKLGRVHAVAVSGAEELPDVEVSVLPNHARGQSDLLVDAANRQLPVGVYTFTALLDSPLGRLTGYTDDVRVREGETTEVKVDLGPTAEVRVESKTPRDAPLEIGFADAGHREILGWIDSENDYRLPAGRYDLYLGPRPWLVERDLVLAPGEKRRILIDAPER